MRARNEACTQEDLFEHFKNEGHSGFLGNVSITLIDKTDGMILKGEKITGWRHSKPMPHLDLILKTVSDESHAEV